MKEGPEPKLTLYSVYIRRRFTIAFALVVALSGGALMERWVLNTGIPPNATEDFRLMSQAWRLIDRFYVDRTAVRSISMTYGAINGMTEALGDTGHSVFLTPDQSKKAGSAVQGRLTGVGIEIRLKDHQTVVVAPIDGSPAQLAGVQAGDVITHVDGRSVVGMGFAQVAGKIAGEAGTSVELTVLNPRDGRKRDIKIVRAAMKINNVSWQRVPGTSLAHLRIAMFSEGESEDLRKALLDIEKQGLKGIILDLRNNPGGVLDEAVQTASQFLSSGNVLWEKDAKDIIVPVPVKPNGVATNVPMIVLINNGSASDSEIVAGALKDQHRARLAGETTFGTGTVLTQFQLLDGSALLLAVQEWLTPDKRSFWHKGIEPDVKVNLPPETPPLLPSVERDMTEDELRAAQDTQLLKAVTLLDGPTLEHQ
ncbi:MAG TPA: S41 family peptidase [Verrucomicrobiae bacterium]|jgi:carboxyl-terminal processing protease|nr:S41 family peptidase [Verrucomicrobiae bacterium]